MFDCVMPTRNARNGTLFTSFGKMNIKAARFKEDDRAIDPECGCMVCKTYSRAYLCHLYRTREITYFRLGTIHNLYYYLNLMSQMREAILANEFEQFKKEFYRKRESWNISFFDFIFSISRLCSLRKIAKSFIVLHPLSIAISIILLLLFFSFILLTPQSKSHKV